MTGYTSEGDLKANVGWPETYGMDQGLDGYGHWYGADLAGGAVDLADQLRACIGANARR